MIQLNTYILVFKCKIVFQDKPLEARTAPKTKYRVLLNTHVYIYSRTPADAQQTSVPIAAGTPIHTLKQVTERIGPPTAHR